MTSPSLQAQARALGDPTRHRIFRALADSATPLTVNELTAGLGLHHNAIRQHLAKLVDAGLVTESIGAKTGGRGRPPLVYELDPAAGDRWGAIGPYERLAGWLTEVVGTGEEPIEIGRRAGRAQIGEHAKGSESLDELNRHLAVHGFEPSRESENELVLGSCPFVSAAKAQPDVVCALHLGFAEGMAAELGGIRILGLHRRPPEQAGCRLRVERTDPNAAH